MIRSGPTAVLLALALTAACAPATTVSRNAGAVDRVGAAPPALKALTVAITEDPGNFWDAITGSGGSGVRELGHMVNQFPATTASDGAAVPRLLVELPSVERGTWRIQPDGGMETTLSLRRDAVWHDGEPLTADDIVFTWQVNRDPDIPNSNAEVARLISGMEARDATTIVVSWSASYPYADRLRHRELFTLPRHLLSQYYPDGKDAMLAQPYFSEQYIGLGPYRVVRWERGSNLELAAFDRYFLGRPKIDIERELVRLATTELPLLPLMYDPDVILTGGGLTGLQVATGTSHNGQIMHTWNIHEWDLRSSSS